MHDSKESAVDDCAKILGVKEDKVREHSLYEKVFSQIFQNEIGLIFDCDDEGNCTLVGLKAAGKEWDL